jgi:hypothetical protein
LLVAPSSDGAVVALGAVADGSVVADGAVVVDGSGLAASTTAVPPTVSRPSAIAAVMTDRRTAVEPLGGWVPEITSGAGTSGSVELERSGGAPGGRSGGKRGSMSVLHCED